MKKLILTGYTLTLCSMLLLQSCDDGPILPNSGENNDVDTTWVSDSSYYGGSLDDDNDSIYWNDDSNFDDSTNVWDNPEDSLGGN